MSFITIIMQILPIILKILAMFGGGMTAASALRLGANPDASWGDYGAWCGSYTAASAASWGIGEAIAWWNRRIASRKIDWTSLAGNVAGVNGVNLLKLIALVARVFQLVSTDPEATRLVKESFGISVSELPKTQNAVAQLIFSPTDK